MKNILITGGAGFIGTALTKKLLNNEYNIIIIDNLVSQVHGHNPLSTSFTFPEIQNMQLDL